MSSYFVFPLHHHHIGLQQQNVLAGVPQPSLHLTLNGKENWQEIAISRV